LVFDQFLTIYSEAITVRSNPTYVEIDPNDVFNTNSVAADQMAAQMQQMTPSHGTSMFGPGQDPNKMYLAEAENLLVAGGQHDWVLSGVESRLLARYLEG